MWMVWSVVGLYLLVGLYLVTKGPLGKWIDQRRKDTWFDFELDAWIAEGNRGQGEAQSDARIRKLSLTFRVLAVLAWPLLLPGALGKKPSAVDVVADVPPTEPVPAPAPAPVAAPSPPRKALKFIFLSGTGEISCLDCGYQQPLAGTLHYRNPETDGNILHLGHQCQSCRKFSKVIRREGLTPDMHCECGGELAREEPLVCPACASQNLDYECFLMT